MHHSIDTAYERLAKHCPELVDHLKAHIKTGESCVYWVPHDSKIDWEL